MPRGLRLLTLALLALALANALDSAWRMGWTYDEPFHLEWTERLLLARNAARESPHYNAKTPVVLPNVLANLAARRWTVSEPWIRLAARLPSIVWLAALLATTFAVTRAWFGPAAGWLALLLAALDPNLTAHGSVVTVDVVYALATLLTVAAAAAFVTRPAPARAAALGLALGLALTAKFSAILLLPTLLLLPLLARPPRREWPRWLAGALLVALLAAAIVCASYLFLDVATPLGAHHWLSRPMRRLARALPALRLPLPRAFLTGYDASLAAERGDWNVVILSRWYPHGTWFYFGVLWLLKTPLLVLAATVAGLWRTVRTRLLSDGGSGLLTRLAFATLLVHLAYFSLVFRTQVGYRFVLMCLPIAYLLAAGGAAALIEADRRRRAAALLPALVWFGVALAVWENALYFGNPLSFTNAAVWPKKQAFRLLADSNLDWGQHDALMEAWSRRPGVRTHLNPLHLLPGHDTLSVNEAAGVSDFERHRFLRENADPGGQIGHTHVWFEIDDALFDRFLEQQRKLVPRPADVRARDCPAGSGLTVTPEAPRHAFLGDAPGAGLAGADRAWLVCVETAGGADLGLRVTRGRLLLGRSVPDQACEGETIEAGQESWHHLAPGSHALCAAEKRTADGRAERFDGSWVVRRGQATVATAPLTAGAPATAGATVDATERAR